MLSLSSRSVSLYGHHVLRQMYVRNALLPILFILWICHIFSQNILLGRMCVCVWQMSDLSMCGQELEGGRGASRIRSAAVSGFVVSTGRNLVK